MRIYTLKCSLCNHVFDTDMLLSQYIQFMDTASSLYTCPKCKKNMHPTRIIMYPITSIYRDDGFTLRKKDNDKSM